MRREEILRFLRQQPFRPFRLRLSNGTTHVIHFPDMALVTLTAIYVGVPQADTAVEAAEDVVVISLMHVVQVEHLTPSPPLPTPPQPASP